MRIPEFIIRMNNSSLDEVNEVTRCIAGDL